jgi:hypothetical protein
MRPAPILLLAVSFSCQSTTAGPAPEVEETQIKLDLPAPPDFVEPKPYADGSHSVAEMRLKGQKLLDQQVRVTGYVVLQYDLNVCARELGERLVMKDPALCDGKKDVAACIAKVGEKAVEETPDQCDRPYFLVADSPSAGIERALWVVEVPRPLRADEKRDPSLVEAFKNGPQPPSVKVGDKVTVTGTWAIKSPAGFGNSEGLLVYGGMETAT